MTLIRDTRAFHVWEEQVRKLEGREIRQQDITDLVSYTCILVLQMTVEIEYLQKEAGLK